MIPDLLLCLDHIDTKSAVFVVAGSRMNSFRAAWYRHTQALPELDSCTRSFFGLFEITLVVDLTQVTAIHFLTHGLESMCAHEGLTFDSSFAGIVLESFYGDYDTKQIVLHAAPGTQAVIGEAFAALGIIPAWAGSVPPKIDIPSQFLPDVVQLKNPPTSRIARLWFNTASNQE